MNDHDGTQEFLQSLPEIESGKSFQFACHPGVNCFNECCADLNLMLTPYDVLRLRQALKLSSEDFINQFATVGQFPDSGFPLLHLKMGETGRKPCPFVRTEGCSVYPDRPGACRTYPVGRAARLDESGEVREQFFLVQEDHCKGFAEDTEWTTDTWLQDQGLERYNLENDRYMRLMSGLKQAGKSLQPRQVTMCLLALYQVDSFQKFLTEMPVFDRLELTDAEKQRILEDEEVCLDFAFNWMELVLYGHSENLKPIQ